MSSMIASLVMSHLLEHAEEHLPAEVAEGGRLVGVDGELVRPDLHVVLAQRLRRDHHLHHSVLLDVSHRVDHLQRGSWLGTVLRGHPLRTSAFRGGREATPLRGNFEL